MAPVVESAARSTLTATTARRIETFDELRALARVPLVLSLAPEVPLRLALPHLTEVESQLWEVRLNREWTACGCRTGEIGAMLGIAAYVSASLLGIAPIEASTWGHVGLATLAALVAAAVGKVVGRGRSLARFRRLTTSLADGHRVDD